jgi:hypothetical protein
MSSPRAIYHNFEMQNGVRGKADITTIDSVKGSHITSEHNTEDCITVRLYTKKLS